MDRRKEWKFETKQLHVGQEEADLATGARAVPIYELAYVFKDSQQAADRLLCVRAEIYMED